MQRCTSKAFPDEDAQNHFPATFRDTNFRVWDIFKYYGRKVCFFFSLEPYKQIRVELTGIKLGHGSYASQGNRGELHGCNLNLHLLKMNYFLSREKPTTLFVTLAEEKCHILSSLWHPNIVPFLGVHFNECRCLVMPWTWHMYPKAWRKAWSAVWHSSLCNNTVAWEIDGLETKQSAFYLVNMFSYDNYYKYYYGSIINTLGLGLVL